ncbi:MAG: c-type cytochrome biogenesis protein CcmI, partial [Gammaproteobacteria bacterium]|nr:c-type cytochrome biogenesis protein CcmI [Gammaproteobacteria bacterium]
MFFWLLSLLLLLPALFIFLWPVLKGRKHQAEEDRTALNVALYQERVTELEALHAQGVLTDEQLEQGRQEAGRDLLEDTELGAPLAQTKLGMALPLIAALLIPVGGAALYKVFGEGEKVALTLSLAEQPKTAGEAIARLENIVKLQPDSAEAWFFLGRTYMNEQQHKKAAQAFDKTMRLVGKQPEVLAQWAQAEYFSTDKRWTDEMQQAVDTVLAADPNDATMLGFVGIAAFESGNFNTALEAWSRLLDQMDPRDPSARAVLTGVERAEQAINEFGERAVDAEVGPVLPPLPDTASLAEQGRISLLVSVAPALLDKLQPEDVVFVFARATSDGQIPLAAQRLTVAQLPAEIVLSDADALMPETLLSAAQD